jgi:hypothetical protein
MKLSLIADLQINSNKIRNPEMVFIKIWRPKNLNFYYLAINSETILSREQLLDNVWILILRWTQMWIDKLH